MAFEKLKEKLQNYRAGSEQRQLDRTERNIGKDRRTEQKLESQALVEKQRVNLSELKASRRRAEQSNRPKGSSSFLGNISGTLESQGAPRKRRVKVRVKSKRVKVRVRSKRARTTLKGSRKVRARVRRSRPKNNNGGSDPFGMRSSSQL